MTENLTNYPKAVASSDPEGIAAAIDWCAQHLEEEQVLTLWTSHKSDLENNDSLKRLARMPGVDHVVRRGGRSTRHDGPVLMAWADIDDIADFTRYGSNNIKALCVIEWGVRGLKPWVDLVRPGILGDASLWEGSKAELHPVLVAALQDMTLMINHNNTISAKGFDKNDVVSRLIALHEANIPLKPSLMKAWSVANGWTGDNAKYLAKYAQDIINGKRPRHDGPRLTPGYVADLQEGPDPIGA